MTVLKKIHDLWQNGPVISIGDYRYVVHPLTDGIPYLEPDLIDEVVREIIKNVDFSVDRIVTIEAMGIPLGILLSYYTKVPLTIIRKKKYALEGEWQFQQKTGYSSATMYVNGLSKGDSIVIVDDIVSTGGTLLNLINLLVSKGVIIKDVCAVIDKGDGIRRIKEETGFEIKTLVKVKENENS